MSLPQRAGHHVVNMYGITETTVHATYRRILASDVATDDARSPIGAPLEHVDIHVLDAHLRPVTEEPGELWISGAGVTAGYVNREDLNRERFRHLDSLGGIRAYRSGDRGIRLTRELVYLGRVDDQVKVRGYRIELGEVEAALRRHPSVRGAVAVVIPLAREELGLVALCTSAPGDPAADATELRRFVAGQVPRHVVPSHIFCVGELPLLPSGKADRAEAADMARRLFAASRSRT